MEGAFFRLVENFRNQHRKRKERLLATKRLGRDESAWAELFRRDDWAPQPVGHAGRCGRCGSRIDPAAHHCPDCGAQWQPNARRSDLYRQILVIGTALALSALFGYAAQRQLRSHFDAAIARGDYVNDEMVDTLTSFLWLFCSVLLMLGFTYVIEKLDLAPIGHWRKMLTQAANESGGRRKDDGDTQLK